MPVGEAKNAVKHYTLSGVIPIGANAMFYIIFSALPILSYIANNLGSSGSKIFFSKSMMVALNPKSTRVLSALTSIASHSKMGDEFFFNTLYLSLPEYIPPFPTPLGGAGVRKHRSAEHN